MTRDFRWTLSTIAHLPAAACTVSAPGSESPPGRGGGAEHRDGRVLFVFAVVSKRLCGAAGIECLLKEKHVALTQAMR